MIYHRWWREPAHEQGASPSVTGVLVRGLSDAKPCGYAAAVAVVIHDDVTLREKPVHTCLMAEAANCKENGWRKEPVRGPKAQP